MNRSLALILVTLGIAAGCSSADTSPDTSSTSNNNSTSNSSSNETPPSPTSLAATVDKDLTIMGDVDMPASTTIAPGVTLTLAAGAKILAGKDAVLIVKGNLVANGTSEIRVQLYPHIKLPPPPEPPPEEWGGIKVEKGGNVTLNYVDIHYATLAFTAEAGSTYAIDHTLVDTSSKLASLSADGTISHSQFHGLGDAQSDSPFSVSSASPKVTDTVIDKGKTGGVDLIVVSGATSAPVFDHDEVANAHCVFHFSGGNKAQITNSFIHDSAYGMMITSAVGTVVTGNNFDKDGINIGTCVGGDVKAEGNYFGGVAPFDGSCKAQTSTGEVSAAITGVGPRP